MKRLAIFFKKIYSFHTKLTDYLTLIAGIIVLLMMALITIASLSRYFLGKSFAVITELNIYSLLLITFLGGPLLSNTNGHISVDLLPTLFGNKGKDILSVVTNTLSFLITALLAWYGLISTINSYASNEIIVDIMHTPKFLLYLIITIGFFLMAISFLSKAIQTIKNTTQQS